MHDLPTVTRRRKVESVKSLSNLAREWLEYFERHQTLAPEEMRRFRDTVQELESRATLLGEYWYELGKREPRLF